MSTTTAEKERRGFRPMLRREREREGERSPPVSVRAEAAFVLSAARVSDGGGGGDGGDGGGCDSY